MAQVKRSASGRLVEPKDGPSAAAPELEIIRRERNANPHHTRRRPAHPHLVSVRGSIPPDLNERVAAAHAVAISSANRPSPPSGASAEPNRVVARQEE